MSTTSPDSETITRRIGTFKVDQKVTYIGIHYNTIQGQTGTIKRIANWIWVDFPAGLNFPCVASELILINDADSETEKNKPE